MKLITYEVEPLTPSFFAVRLVKPILGQSTSICMFRDHWDILDSLLKNFQNTLKHHESAITPLVFLLALLALFEFHCCTVSGGSSKTNNAFARVRAPFPLCHR
jgi:hypothetical protein